MIANFQVLHGNKKLSVIGPLSSQYNKTNMNKLLTSLISHLLLYFKC